MREGKADEKELNEHVFGIISHRRKEVTESAVLGRDAARIDCGAVLVHTDPITGRCKNIGSLAINVAANDVAAAGGEPVAFLLTVILPVASDASELGRIMADAERECVKIDAEIVGGHSEFSSAVTRPVVNAVALAKPVKGFSVRKAMPGDDILLTKSAATEAAVLISERKPGLLSEEETGIISAMRGGLSVVNDCKAVAGSVSEAYMHDVTEGGVENAVWEMAAGAGVGARIYAEKIAVSPIAEKLCRALNISPLRCLSSGALLIAVKNGTALAEKLADKGVSAAVIGSVTGERGVYISENGTERELGPVSDELLAAEDKPCTV